MNRDDELNEIKKQLAKLERTLAEVMRTLAELTKRMPAVPGKDPAGLEAAAKGDLFPATVLTVSQLAAAIGPRRGGRPTNVETVRAWMLQGIQGVILESWMDVSVRKTTWAAYIQWRDKLARHKAETRKRLRELAKSMGRRAEKARLKRQAEAKRRLEEMGAR